ncbi:HAD family hydrolase [Alphaproteobacteria bacterium]|nr:HAD family hydrolase [Alphaproteobacteria bacterium]MDC1121555.1 HAD family hydrolase [Alphaproteobacteria bacterium]
MVNKAVFLDRDGVINQAAIWGDKPYAPRRIEDFKILAGAEDAIVKIKALGYLVLVVTNQPDINNKLVNPVEVNAMHDRLAHLPIEKIYVCPHSQNEGCLCRKPNPGMLFQARDEFNIDLSRSFMVGDRQGDMQASKSAGCTSVFIDNNYGETKIVNYDFICYDLLDFSELLAGFCNVKKFEN